MLSGWPAIDIIFLGCAVAGGAAFLVWLVLQFIGADFDADTDVDFSATEASGSADVSFTLLSFQGLSAFLTIFGLVGLSAHREIGAPAPIALGVGALAGILLSWAIGRLFVFFNSLQSSGTIDVESAVGEEGTVYLTVPESGEGKVQLTLQGRFRVLPAISLNQARLETGTRVRVMRVDDGHTLVVRRA